MPPLLELLRRSLAAGELQDALDKVPRNDVLMLLGDFNARVGVLGTDEEEGREWWGGMVWTTEMRQGRNYYSFRTVSALFFGTDSEMLLSLFTLCTGNCSTIFVTLHPLKFSPLLIILTRWTCANCTTATSIAWRTF